MQDRPTAGELLKALADFLHSLPPLLAETGLADDAVTAADLVQMLAREQQLGAGHLLQERRLLCRLMDLDPEDLLPGSLTDQVADLNQQLVAEIEDNSLSPRARQSVAETLRQILANKLAVVAPGHDAWDSGVEVP